MPPRKHAVTPTLMSVGRWLTLVPFLFRQVRGGGGSWLFMVLSIEKSMSVRAGVGGAVRTSSPI